MPIPGSHAKMCRRRISEKCWEIQAKATDYGTKIAHIPMNK
jgi:hypothetical protein